MSAQPTPVVEVKDVTRVYSEKGSTPTTALGGVSLTVEKGEFMALAGPSGSGKTTLLNLIGALDRPNAGSVKIAGRDVASMSRKQLADLRRDEIGFVFQAYNLVPVLTAKENAEYVLQLRGVPAKERAQKVTELFERRHVQLPLEAGDAVFFNPALYHGAGTNTSADIRRG